MSTVLSFRGRASLLATAVRVCMDAGIVFYGAQVDYTLPS